MFQAAIIRGATHILIYSCTFFCKVCTKIWKLPIDMNFWIRNDKCYIWWAYFHHDDQYTDKYKKQFIDLLRPRRRQLKLISYKRIHSKEVLHIWALLIHLLLSSNYLSQKTIITFLNLSCTHRSDTSCWKREHFRVICKSLRSKNMKDFFGNDTLIWNGL